MKIRLTLKKSLIFEAVKAETYIKGRYDNAAQIDGKAVKLAYEEEIGDEEFYERKLERTLVTALAVLKGILSDYLSPIPVSSGDNNIDITTKDDDIIILLNVSDRFNGSQVDALAKLCSKFLEDSMLNQWWGTFNPNQAQFYAAQLAVDKDTITTSFNKLAPTAPKTKYTNKLAVHNTEIQAEVGEVFSINYEIDGDCIDDIEYFVENPYIAIADRTHDEGSFKITCLHRGVTLIRLFSRHNDDAVAEITLIVKKDR